MKNVEKPEGVSFHPKPFPSQSQKNIVQKDMNKFILIVIYRTVFWFVMHDRNMRDKYGKREYISVHITNTTLHLEIG